MKTWGSGGIAPPFLTSALDGCELSTSHPGCLTPGESIPYPFDKRLGGPQSQSEHGGEMKNLAPARNQTPVIQPVACCNTDRAIPTPKNRRHASKCYIMCSAQQAVVCLTVLWFLS
jgi:hypothetical protein